MLTLLINSIRNQIQTAINNFLATLFPAAGRSLNRQLGSGLLGGGLLGSSGGLLGSGGGPLGSGGGLLGGGTGGDLGGLLGGSAGGDFGGLLGGLLGGDGSGDIGNLLGGDFGKIIDFGVIENFCIFRISVAGKFAGGSWQH